MLVVLALALIKQGLPPVGVPLAPGGSGLALICRTLMLSRGLAL